MIRAFEVTLGFLTVFRVRVDPPPDLAEVGKSAWAFPVVGAVIGVILAACGWMVAPHLPGAVTALLVVGLWVVITGGLHLDGWADCCDSLTATVSVERRLEILKDSRLGTFGALGLILALGIKTAAIADQGTSWTMVLLAPVIGRGVLVLSTYGAAHTGRGMAADWLSGLNDRTVVWAGILGLIPALIAGWTGIVAAAAAYGGAIWFRNLAVARLGALNGDVIGAICEFSETIFLFVACVRW